MFKITHNSGFHMTFKNGVTISVQVGPGSYSDNREMWQDVAAGATFETLKRLEIEAGKKGSRNAEVAIWRDASRFRFDDGDIVKGWVDADEVARWIEFAANLPADMDIGKLIVASNYMLTTGD